MKNNKALPALATSLNQILTDSSVLMAPTHLAHWNVEAGAVAPTIVAS